MTCLWGHWIPSLRRRRAYWICVFQYSHIYMFDGSSDLSTMTVVFVGSLGHNKVSDVFVGSSDPSSNSRISETHMTILLDFWIPVLKQ